MTQKFLCSNRRSLLRAAPVFALAAAPLPALAENAESEIVRSYRVWKAWLDWYNGPQSFSDAECNRLTELRFAEEERILAIPSRDVFDVLAKIMIISHEGEFGFSEAEKGGGEIVDEAHAMLGAGAQPLAEARS